MKNAYNAKKKFFTCKNSKFIFSLCLLLKKEGLIHGFLIDPNRCKNLIILLKYVEGDPFLKSIDMISKSSQRFYVSQKKLMRSFLKEGFFLVSSSKFGLSLSSNLDKTVNIAGGEILARIIF